MVRGFFFGEMMAQTMSTSSVTHRQIWQLAGPMIIANISIPILGMVDTAVMGHLDSPHYIGAVAIGALIFSFLFWGFGFLRMATTGLTAQASGSLDQLKIQQVLQQSLLIAWFIAILILIFQKPIGHLAFYYIDGSDLVKNYARDYFDIRIWSTPAILTNYVILGWLIGRESIRAALVLVLIVTVSNIILDFVFVNLFSMTVGGVAWASVIAEYLGLIAALIFVQQRGIKLAQLKPALETIKNSALTQGLSLHGNIFIRTLCLIFSFAFFTIQGAKQGDVVLAANAVLLNFITFMAFVLDGFANAVEVITGKAIGRKDPSQLKQGLILAGVWSAGVAILFSLFYSMFGLQLIGLLTSIPSVAQASADYLIWLIVAPLIAVWSYLFDGLFIGATRSKEMRNTMLFASLFCYLPSWYFLQHLGNHGLWIALLVFLAARSISQACYLPSILKVK